MRLAVVGTGYVGLVSGTCFSDTGNDVHCLDVDVEKIRSLKDGISPIYEPGLTELIERNLKAKRLHFTTEASEAYFEADAIFICVGTPSDARGRADLQYVFKAAKQVGDAIEARPSGSSGGAPPIVVVKSTVPVGTNAKVKAIIQARTEKPFCMASNPEFLKEGAAITDFFKPDRVVLGVEDEGVGDRLSYLYRPYVRQGNPILVMDIPSAEMVKYASNAMLATKISFINEIARLSEAYGAEIEEVRRGMCSDRRIGNQFLYPGLGYGGSCFPKDVLACISMGEDAGVPARLLSAVHGVNQEQRLYFVRKIEAHFGSDLSGRRIALWGVAFKPRTDDIREAPAITVAEWLLERGAEVVAWDPVALDNAREYFGETLQVATSDLEALDGADALVICTEWPEFRRPDLEALRARLKQPVVFDGRNLYRPKDLREAGFTYYSVGRRPVDSPS